MNSKLKDTLRRLKADLADDDFRNAYFARQLKSFLSSQIRALRGKKTQRIFGYEIGKPQSVVSRLENENISGIHLQTLIDIAKRLKLGLLIRFVSFDEFLRYTSNYDENAVAPESYNQEKIEMLSAEVSNIAREQDGLLALIQMATATPTSSSLLYGDALNTTWSDSHSLRVMDDLFSNIFADESNAPIASSDVAPMVIGHLIGAGEYNLPFGEALNTTRPTSQTSRLWNDRSSNISAAASNVPIVPFASLSIVSGHSTRAGGYNLPSWSSSAWQSSDNLAQSSSKIALLERDLQQKEVELAHQRARIEQLQLALLLQNQRRATMSPRRKPRGVLRSLSTQSVAGLV
jgi:hypothetical protein